MMKVKVKLRSICNVKGSEGMPGDVVDMEKVQADAIVEGQGGEIIEEEKRKPAKRTDSK